MGCNVHDMGLYLRAVDPVAHRFQAPFSFDTRKDARRCRAGPLLVRLFWHDRAGSSILPALSEHLGVEDVEV